MGRQSLPHTQSAQPVPAQPANHAGAAGHVPDAGAAGHPSAGAAGHSIGAADAGAAGHVRPVLALCCAGIRCRPVLPRPLRGKSCRPHPPPTPLSSMAWHAPPRTLFFTRSTHFVKPHTENTPLPKQNAPPSHYYKNLEKHLSNATHLHIRAVYVYSCRHAEPPRQL